MITARAPAESREFSRSELSRDSKNSTSSTSRASDMTRTASQYSALHDHGAEARHPDREVVQPKMDGRWPGWPPIHDSSRVAERRKGIEEWEGAQSFSPAARARGSGRTRRCCPKPLLPVGDRAILDVVVHQLRDAGFDDLTLAVGYLSHLVRAVMGDGSTPRREHRLPRGARAARHRRRRCATIDGLDDTFLMMNGDVLTALDYAHLVDVHRESGQRCSRSPPTAAWCAPSTA